MLLLLKIGERSEQVQHICRDESCGARDETLAGECDCGTCVLPVDHLGAHVGVCGCAGVNGCAAALEVHLNGQLLPLFQKEVSYLCCPCLGYALQ